MSEVERVQGNRHKKTGEAVWEEVRYGKKSMRTDVYNELTSVESGKTHIRYYVIVKVFYKVSINEFLISFHQR